MASNHDYFPQSYRNRMFCLPSEAYQKHRGLPLPQHRSETLFGKLALSTNDATRVKGTAPDALLRPFESGLSDDIESLNHGM
jgi:hypothetical protein